MTIEINDIFLDINPNNEDTIMYVISMSSYDPSEVRYICHKITMFQPSGSFHIDVNEVILTEDYLLNWCSPIKNSEDLSEHIDQTIKAVVYLLGCLVEDENHGT